MAFECRGHALAELLHAESNLVEYAEERS